MTIYLSAQALRGYRNQTQETRHELPSYLEASSDMHLIEAL